MSQIEIFFQKHIKNLISTFYVESAMNCVIVLENYTQFPKCECGQFQFGIDLFDEE